MADEPISGPYTDAMLDAILTSAGGLNQAVAVVWREKAAATADLVTVSESGSSRSMGDLHKNALSMAAYYDKMAEPPVVAPENSTPFTVATDRQ